jgi:Xaa-Pro aminopeptidase
VVALSPWNTLYFAETYIMTQVSIPDRLAISVFPLEQEPAFIACGIEKKTAEVESWIGDMRFYMEFQQSPIDLLADVLEEKGLTGKKIGIELDYLMAHYYIALTKRLPKTEFVPCKRVFAKVRMIKEPQEIACLTYAATNTRQAMEKAIAEVNPGCTELAFAHRIMADMVYGGSTGGFFVMGSGEKSLEVHALPTGNIMEDGEVMRLDLGGIYEGQYLSDMARTVMIGKENPTYLDAYNRLREVYVEVIANMTVGKASKEIFGLYASLLTKAGFECVAPHVGHSLGLEVHEYPMLSPVEDCLLQENMVFCLEPVVFAHGRMFHMEDLIQITADGPKILSNTSFDPGVPWIK